MESTPLLSRYSDVIEVGCDEVGRGCLAGPVVAGAVIFPADYKHPTLTDSKQLSPSKRKQLQSDIIRDAMAWNVAFVDNREIDRTNILRAAIAAMHIAIEGLSIIPEFIIVDGNCFYPYRNIPHQTFVKGDSRYLSIAAASILAKVARDEYMERVAINYPQYGWEQNKGYGTKAHRIAIEKFGITPLHRQSFTLFNKQMTLDF